MLRQITYNCALLGVGQTFVIITAGIDLSVGSLVALTGVVAALFANSVHLSGFPLIAATLVVCLAVGAAAGWVNALPVVKLNLPPFITTLAMLEMALGGAFILSHGRPIALQSTALQNTGIGSFFGGVTSGAAPSKRPDPGGLDARRDRGGVGAAHADALWALRLRDRR